MKRVLGWVFMLAWASSFAQQAPRAMMSVDQVPQEAEGPRKWPDRPGKVMQAPFGIGGAGTEQANLMRAQTEAIKALSAKVDQLEARINKLEKGVR